MIKQFIVDMVRGKGRPLTVKRRDGKGVMTFTPDRTVEFENEIIYKYKAIGGENFLQDKPFGMIIDIYMKIPKSFSKKKREQALKGEIFPTKTPDDDNVVKAITDALNGIGYNDDCQRCFLTVNKKYSVIEYCEIFLGDIEHFKLLQELFEKYREDHPEFYLDDEDLERLEDEEELERLE